MPRKFIQRHMPTPERIAALPGIHRLGSRITEPNLWYINRKSISGAVFWGIICAWIPFPAQMLVAAICAITFRVNLPLSVAITWITNPFTLIPIFYTSYCVGSFIFGIPILNLSEIKDVVVHFSSGMFSDSAPLATTYDFSMRALLVGVVVEAVIVASIGYLIVQLLWRCHVMNEWKTRHDLPNE
jgi:uncharacterized protein (DUF2062 family)